MWVGVKKSSDRGILFPLKQSQFFVFLSMKEARVTTHGTVARENPQALPLLTALKTDLINETNQCLSPLATARKLVGI